MSEHRATVEWQRSGEFRYATYSRSHTLRFDGIAVPGSAAPANIPATATGAAGVDPEQAFVGAISSCHMLWFLHLACQKQFVVDRYVDKALGVLDKTWVSRVTLRPEVTFSGKAPTEEEHKALHHRAHEKCYIANSVKTEIVVEPCLK
jgi:organic hydroperoxide reductase OsmC/OhrA